MSIARSFSTATSLPNGKILLAGGNSGSVAGEEPLATAELYDPATATFTPTGSMASARHSHTATLLADGKVLVAGGLAGPTFRPIYLDTAELYDPSTETFTPTSALFFLRARATATVLPDGRVLIAGGVNAGTGAPPIGFPPIAELYNPSTGTFTLTGSLNAPRDAHTATLLPDGKVLIAGGSGAIGNLSTAEIYDPSAGEFMKTAASSVGARTLHTATLLPDGKVLLAGGRESGGPSPTAELFDPQGP
jgi:WD40 repeat protein